jgi:hypothetical protein
MSSLPDPRLAGNTGPPNIHAYQIRHRIWQTPCAWCGSPLFYGDEAYQTPGGPPCCSEACASRLAVAHDRLNPPSTDERNAS